MGKRPLPFYLAYDDRTKLVDTFANGLEHDESKRNANDGVTHCEQLSAYRVRRRVAVTCL